MKILRIVTVFILLLLLGYFGIKSYHHAKLYESTTASLAKHSDINGLAQGKLDTFTSVISFGLIKNRTKEKLDELKEQQNSHKTDSQEHLYFFMATLSILIIFSFTCSLLGSTLALALSSLISLIFGLLNPILMVTIHKEVEHLGDIILSFESKGIIGSITKLFENGEHVVAITILLFSVILPLLKIITLMGTLLFKSSAFSHHLINFFRHIGKWSMIDVFVVAIFLVYLTSNKGSVSHAEIQIGLYYFLAYVLLSMVTTIQTQRVLKQE